MFEVLAALAVILLVILALVGVTANSVRNADFAKKQATATQYAQEGMEKLRSYRDQNSWDTFILANCNSVVGSVAAPFTRTATCAPVGVQREATVTVSWSDSKGTHQSKLVSYFTEW